MNLLRKKGDSKVHLKRTKKKYNVSLNADSKKGLLNYIRNIIVVVPKLLLL